METRFENGFPAFGDDAAVGFGETAELFSAPGQEAGGDPATPFSFQAQGDTNDPVARALGEDMAALAALETVGGGPVGRLTVDHERGVFELPDGRAAQRIEGHVVKWGVRRARWEDDRLACLSRDGTVGRLLDGTEVACGGCPHRAGACKVSLRVYFVPSDRHGLWYFDVPPGQKNAFVQYVQSVMGGGDKGVPTKPVAMAVTAISLQKLPERRAARFKFEAVGEISKEELAALLALRDELMPLVEEHPAPRQEQEIDAAPGGGLDDIVF